MSTSDKIEAAKAKASAALTAELVRITRDGELRQLAPYPDAVKRTTVTRYDGVSSIRYEAATLVDARRIIDEWREKYGAFLPIGKYVSGCCVVTAYPHEEYAEPEALKMQADDAVMARNSCGRGFSSVEFTFYPQVPGERVMVEIDMAFRSPVGSFAGHIRAHYNRNGDPTTAEKFPPTAHCGAEYTVSFGGGSRDSADWRGIFRFDAIMGELAK